MNRFTRAHNRETRQTGSTGSDADDRNERGHQLEAATERRRRRDLQLRRGVPYGGRLQVDPGDGGRQPGHQVHSHRPQDQPRVRVPYRRREQGGRRTTVRAHGSRGGQGSHRSVTALFVTMGI